MTEERRRYQRIPIDCPIVVKTEDGMEHTGKVLDISVHGVLAKLDTVELSSEKVSVRIELSEGTPAFAIEAEGETVRRSPEGFVGVYFLRTDEESLTLLRRLLELNLGDTELARSEIKKW